MNGGSRCTITTSNSTSRLESRYFCNSAIAYQYRRCVYIGSLSVVYQHCNAFKFQSETPGICCAGGKTHWFTHMIQYPLMFWRGWISLENKDGQCNDRRRYEYEGQCKVFVGVSIDDLPSG
ncbi:uncharacterized protein LOC111072096 [Drosophila obscura]|uniref:uncharacterized protein LOC111072096 n=1 Tax=Drosophila obscura TaxID=7282 RepID=UPI001BB11078|nr:uncharacterized protein LOC111072096 [Drosophila obscura]